jgi:hypothetical protein
VKKSACTKLYKAAAYHLHAHGSLYCYQPGDLAKDHRIRPVETASSVVEAWRVNQEELPAVEAHINESRILCAYSGKTSLVIRSIS